MGPPNALSLTPCVSRWRCRIVDTFTLRAGARLLERKARSALSPDRSDADRFRRGGASSPWTPEISAVRCGVLTSKVWHAGRMIKAAGGRGLTCLILAAFPDLNRLVVEQARRP